MKLRIGLSGSGKWWTRALDQEKTPYQILENTLSALDPSQYPVCLLTELPSSQIVSKIKSFLVRGGALVSVSEASGAFDDLREAEGRSRIFYVQNPHPFESTEGKFCLKKFNVAGDLFVTETVARHPFGEWRRDLVMALKKAYTSIGLPYARLHYCPAPYQNIFSFRMDFDHFIESDFEQTLKILKEYPDQVSCFINTYSFENRLPELKKLNELDVEIGSHAYVHHVYDRHEQNRRNLERAENFLRPLSKYSHGFSSPHGKWHPTLQTALDQNRYLYSSEFTLNHDDLPFYPQINGQLSSVLQIPTHAICEGVFIERHGYQESMLNDYHAKLFEIKKAQGEPILLFGHPDGRIGRYPGFFHYLMRLAQRDSSLWKTTFKSWAQCWKLRSTWSLDLGWENGLRAINAPDDLRARLELWMPKGARFEFGPQELTIGVPIARLVENRATFESISLHTFEGIEVKKSIFKKIKHLVRDWLDWEIKTPISFYAIRTPKDYLRRAIRIIHDFWLPRDKKVV